MRAFVTGAAGFAGRHLIALLRAAGDEVSGLIKPGTPAPEGVTVAAVDVLDGEAVTAVIRKSAPEAIYHLAGLSAVGGQWERRREYLETNFLGALPVLEAARQASPMPAVLLIGSASQYGRAPAGAGPIAETTPLTPIDLYGVAKAAQELLGQQYFRADGVPAIAVRAFNHAGAGQGPGFVIADWAKGIAEIEAGRRPPVLDVGNLDVERDFCDVRDVVRAYRMLIAAGRPGEAYNVCSGVGRPLGQVLEGLRSLATKPFAVRSGAARRVDIRSFVGSREKIRKDVGWEPEVPFEDTLRAALDYWRGQVA